MSSFLSNTKTDFSNPLDFIEEIVVDNNWSHNRVNENALYVEISGQWCDYFLSLAWNYDTDFLQYTCTYNMRIPSDKEDSICILLNKINSDLCFGHFELWGEDGWVLYRNSISTNNEKKISSNQIKQIFSLSITECDKFYPTFQFLLWDNKSPIEAIDAAMLKTLGEA